MVAIKDLALSALLMSSALAFPFQNPFKIANLPKPGEKPVPGGSPVSICDSTQPQLLTLKELVMTPNPPERGANLTISGTGFLKETVDDGAYVDVDVSYGYIKLLHQTFDLCEEVSEVDLKCPVKAGAYEITKEVEIPAQVPPGKYVVYARAYTKDDDLIACITGSVEFTPNGVIKFDLDA
ncbi:unnamed protein product [Kuraishia capsulata CBS 1993]|uniref:Phosphatidylglycerol/phosphatidylinositol transfer protein n=1 Tax=Kuraishia capsulata CBS 1993 TaxID=1382522 RepID=W6MQ75_9ASCO|nr:uncharacterized protein KUCA_T00004874001 [Kuraishia capsulata CBS 1993]CDK28889.1 unnamed protein product [Kuraishia capsulata CBS 1993]